ncbi:MAG: class I SAM-dependent RNA methyltransferase [Deltaproteobacteria bacterium]|nr:class I SAM-dependent RNA methyltransferase [Deltaproteobacteria bacterium]
MPAPGDLLRVRFETLTVAGSCKGTPDGNAEYSVFTHRAAPGDVATVRVTAVNKRYVEADIAEIHEPSPHRVEPPCPIFDECGGCDWQHVAYDAQLAARADIARYLLKRIGADDGVLAPAVPSPPPFGYRMRGDLHARRNGEGRIVLGFRKRRSHDIVEARTCPLYAAPLADSFALVAGQMARSQLEPERTYRVRLVADDDTPRLAIAASPIGEGAPLLLRVVHMKTGGELPWSDDEPFTMRVGDKRLAYHPLCFTQVNAEVNERIVADAVAALDLEENDKVLELFSGIGNFTAAVASRAANVAAVESSKFSVEWARRNLVDASNVRFIARGALPATRRMAGDRFDKILADPPRTGLGPDLIANVARMRPTRIVYVSCGLDSLARDLRMFLSRGFRITRLAPYDMFPQTRHTEHVAVLDCQEA